MAGNAGVVCVSQVHCKKVLGTDDPDQVQKQLKDWDKFDQVAQKMNAAGYKMLSGYDDSYRAFSNNVSHPWVVGNKIVIDENIKKWIRQTKEYAQKDYNNHTTLWSPQWTQDQGPDGNVFGFFYSTWGINFTLMGNALADSSKPAEKEMEFTEIMPCVKVHRHITGAVHGCVRRREPIIFLLSGI